MPEAPDPTPTPAQRRLLRALEDGKAITRADYVGSSYLRNGVMLGRRLNAGTVYACRQHGWIGADGRLTAAGRAALERDGAGE